MLMWTEKDEEESKTTGWTLLHWAALASDAQAITELVEEGLTQEEIDCPTQRAWPDMLIFQYVTPLIVAMSPESARAHSHYVVRR